MSESSILSGNPSLESVEQTFSDVNSEVNVEFSTRESDLMLIGSKFGMHKDQLTGKVSIVRQFKWINKNNIEVEVISYGATIRRILIPDKNGLWQDVVLGFDNMEGYQGGDNPHIGCTVGRVANRIANGHFRIEDKEFNVDKNAGQHHLHGGSYGFDKRNWVCTVDGIKVRMCLLSPDGDGGYPGDVLATVTFYLDNENLFHIEMEGICTKPTLLNMTNHSYFNLAGHGSGSEELYEHIVTINADRITVNDADTIPTGKFKCVGGTEYDFRVPRQLGHALSKVECGGYDNNFCVTKGSNQRLGFMGRVWHPKSGRYLEVYSDQPGLQFYTANSMPNPDRTINPKETYEGKHLDYKTENITHLEPISIGMSRSVSESMSVMHECASDSITEPISGKDGAFYKKHAAFCMEPQNYPDAINHPEFPSIILNPGETYSHEILFKFGISD